jgi:hypothetical protein
MTLPSKHEIQQRLARLETSVDSLVAEGDEFEVLTQDDVDALEENGATVKRMDHPGNSTDSYSLVEIIQQDE